MGSDQEVEEYSLRLAEAIKARREQAGLSRNRLAELSAISQPMVGLIERNIHSPTVETLVRLAKNLGVTPSELLAEVERGSGATAPENPSDSH